MPERKRRNIPEKARKNRSIRKAREFIVRSGIRWLPVDPFSLYEQYGWYLFTWHEARRVLHERDPLKLRKTGAEARTSIPRGTNEVVTVYDSDVIPFNRIRWTLAHEIGHIVLGHLTEFEETAVNRGGLTKEQYSVLEEEADFFAAELLEPMAILKAIGALTPQEIARVCRVSQKAAFNRARDMEWWGHTRIALEADAILQRQFSLYLTPVAVCGTWESPVKSVTLKYPKVVRIMNKKHLYVPVDENNRFLFCPKCGNKEFSSHANFCKMCGFYLYNTCQDEMIDYTDHEDYDESGNKIYIPRTNPGDARYCEWCGKETLLSRLGLLLSWEEVIQAHSEIAAGLEPKQKEDDIPF